ncbi:cell division cycle protein 27 homolog [Anthonomus grandis grandis]|uniref:cell division cycle protein 27 homolog n=1 Tax=Anthonomus grandis grandis TaxID=2921223 RepID=UPI00216665E1|nr:cell division cycle protein 27 homolog [Anthonomus grandis grandis]
MIVQEPVQAAIWHCLNHYDYSNAVFLSERLYAEVKTDEILFLLATAYYRSGKKQQAYYSLHKDLDGLSSQCQLLYAQCAYELERYAEAESALTEGGSSASIEQIVVHFGEEAAFALLLLGKICAKTERRPRAVEAWKKALKINPFLFSAFESLCKFGEKPNPVSIFQTDNIENMSDVHGHSINDIETVFVTTPMDNQLNEKDISLRGLKFPSVGLKHLRLLKQRLFMEDDTPSPLPNWRSGLEPLTQTGKKCISGVGALLETESPSFGFLCDNKHVGDYIGTPGLSHFSPALMESNPHQSIGKRSRVQVDQIISRKTKESVLQQNTKPVLSQSSNLTTPSTPVTNHLTTELNQNVRRSSRLFSSCSVKENNKSPSRNKFVTPKSPSKKSKQRLVKSVNKNNHEELNANNENSSKDKPATITSDAKIEKNANHSSVHEDFVQQAVQMQKQSCDGLMALLRNIGQAYVALRSYDCHSAIKNLLALPSNQFNTCWVYTLMGLAYFEMNDYEPCIKYFEMVHEREPDRLDYLDVYSTALWHLQKEVSLSALAQDLVTRDKNHPVTWVVQGNCFSLHKEHDTAIKYFQRAVQLDRTHFYAYTLLGHEYIYTEELEKALNSFRTAVRINPMHYNAWFGMGNIYSMQQKYDWAELHYNKALAINRQSCIILCHIGMVQQVRQQTEKALATFNKAIAANPKSPLSKFHRASVYFTMGRNEEALKELEELKELVPNESSIYYLIGKIHKKLGNTDLALQHFSRATALDPKGAIGQIKEGINPTMGDSNAEVLESPHSPISDDLESESNMGSQGLEESFDALPGDSDDSVFY